MWGHRPFENNPMLAITDLLALGSPSDWILITHPSSPQALDRQSGICFAPPVLGMLRVN